MKAMTPCPNCSHKPTVASAYCPECKAFRGSPDDRAAFLWFLGTIFTAVCVWVTVFVIAPRQELAEAIRRVKAESPEDVGRIRDAHKERYILLDDPGLGWGGDVFPNLALVTFSYMLPEETSQKTGEPRRLAVWWAVKDAVPGVSSVESVGHFADAHLIQAIFTYLGIDEVPEKAPKKS